MDSLNRDRNQMIKAILSAVDSGKLSFSEINLRVKNAIDVELEKPESEMNTKLIETYVDLLCALRPEETDEDLGALRTQGKRFVRKVKFHRRLSSVGKTVVSSACVAAVLILFTFIGSGLMDREWISGKQSGDEQQYIVKGHETDTGLTSQAIASEGVEEIELTTATLEELIEKVGNLLPMPSWIPEQWTVTKCHYARNTLFSQLSIYYASDEAQILAFTVAKYNSQELASASIEQSYQGDYVNISGRKVYISQNIDKNIYVWSHDLELYTMYGKADFDEVSKIIESIKE